MIKKLIIAGLILIPFYELIVQLFPFAKSIAPDTRVTKEILAAMFALSIGCIALYKGELKPYKNKGLFIFVGFLLISYHLAFKPPIAINQLDMSGIWLFKPMFLCMVYLIFIIAVASMKVTRADIETFFKVIMYCCFGMAVYAIFQSLGFDQFWAVKGYEQILDTPNANIAGVLGQPTLLSPYLALGIPICWYFKKYILAGVLAYAVYLVNSDMTFFSLGCSLLLMLILFKRQWIPLLLVTMVALIPYVDSKLMEGKLFNISLEGNGRYELWKNSWTKFKDNPLPDTKSDFSITGVGLGNFALMYSPIQRLSFAQMHNDPYELLLCVGWVGAGIFVLALFGFLYPSILSTFWVADIRLRMIVTLLGSLFVIIINSCGSFMFQLGVYQFYSSLIIGFLTNAFLKGGRNEKYSWNLDLFKPRLKLFKPILR